jgi:putative addiction module component (TIGR02574 family)
VYLSPSKSESHELQDPLELNSRGAKNMGTMVESLLNQALQMPAQDRAVIAERLISSLDTEIDQEVEIAWQQEVQRRVEEVDKGVVACIPWEQVLPRFKYLP